MTTTCWQRNSPLGFDRASAIDVGDLDSALEVVRAGLAYANMHTVNFAGGEIRGQVRGGMGQGRGE
jgi:CHRD domain